MMSVVRCWIINEFLLGNCDGGKESACGVLCVLSLRAGMLASLPPFHLRPDFFNLSARVDMIAKF